MNPYGKVKRRVLSDVIGSSLNNKYKANLRSRTAGIVGDNLVSIDGKGYTAVLEADAPVGGTVEVVNIGRPAVALYAPKEGGGSIVVGSASGGTTSISAPSTGSSYAEGAGIDISNNVISVDVTDIFDSSYGLTESGNRIRIDLASTPGLEFSSGIKVKADASRGISLDSSGVGVLLGSTPGLVFDTGLKMKVPSDPLTVSTTGAVNANGHTHAITTTSDGADDHSTILQSGASGDLTLDMLTVADILAPSSLELRPTASVVLDPGDQQILPGGSIEDDLGAYNTKFRTLYAAELYVETLVAQDVMSTIGGRIIVTPTSVLVADMDSGDSTMDVKHNHYSSGDFVFLEAAPGGAGQFEALKITSAASTIGADHYRYSVTRNQHGSGARDWVAGDAVASLGGAVGEGYIDLASTQTVYSQIGPVITINTRTGTTAWNQVAQTVAMGNLYSFVDYGSNAYGFAVGNDLTYEPDDATDPFVGFTGDSTDGVRLFNTPLSIYDTAEDEWGLAIDADGINIVAGTGDSYNKARSIDWVETLGADAAVRIRSYISSGTSVLSIQSGWAGGTSYIGAITMTAYDDDGTTSGYTTLGPNSFQISEPITVGGGSTDLSTFVGSLDVNGTVTNDFAGAIYTHGKLQATGVLDIDSTGESTIAGRLTVSDYVTADGYALVGAFGASASDATFSQKDFSSHGGVALRQTANGDTVLNAASSRDVFIRINDSTSDIGRFNGSYVNLNQIVKMQASETITSNPTAAASNGGWKASLYSTTYAIGVATATNTLVLKSNNWVAAFDGVNPSGSGSPDGNACWAVNQYRMYVQGSLGESWNDVATAGAGGVDFETGWSNYSSAWNNISYKKFGDMVFIRGMCDYTSGGDGHIFTLPSGYFDAVDQSMFVCECSYSSTETQVRVTINTSGEVVVLDESHCTNWLNLDGIVFSIA